jgi:hypothetical protein
MGKPNGSRHGSGIKGGVGGSMCPDWGQMLQVIPNNTALEGTITKVLHGLTVRSNELAINSGIHDPLTNQLEQWFGKWKGVMASILTSLIVVFESMALIVCCAIPCIRGIIF